MTVYLDYNATAPMHDAVRGIFAITSEGIPNAGYGFAHEVVGSDGNNGL